VGPPALRDPGALVTSLSAVTRRSPADRTRNAFGRWLRRLGLHRPLPAPEIAHQAQALIPQAAAHVATLIRLFLDASAPG